MMFFNRGKKTLKPKNYLRNIQFERLSTPFFLGPYVANRVKNNEFDPWMLYPLN